MTNIGNPLPDVFPITAILDRYRLGVLPEEVGQVQLPGHRVGHLRHPGCRELAPQNHSLYRETFI